jgi:hypothetical protein
VASKLWAQHDFRLPRNPGADASADSAFAKTGNEFSGKEYAYSKDIGLRRAAPVPGKRSSESNIARGKIGKIVRRLPARARPPLPSARAAREKGIAE